MVKSTRFRQALFVSLLLLTVPQIVLACVWEVEIEKCSSGWIPTKDGTTNITATITGQGPGLTGTIKFTLQSVSDEPGYCMNAGTETTTDKDLQFVQDEQTGFTVGGTYYDPSYGTTGLPGTHELAPAHPVGYPAATVRTGNAFPPSNQHDSGWECQHY